MTAYCRCNHNNAAHAHYRVGTECADCPKGQCPKFRRTGPLTALWRRIRGAR